MGAMIFVVVLVCVVVLFSVQNASPVAVAFLFWDFQASLAIVIFLSLVSGIIIGAVIALWKGRRRSRDKATEAGPQPVNSADGPGRG